MVSKQVIWSGCRRWSVVLYVNSPIVMFVVVDDSTGDILVRNIQEFVEQKRAVVTYEWAGYICLTGHNFDQQTVCHKRNFVNPETGFHTKAIGRAWKEGKT